MRTLLIADDERTIREGIAGAVNWESLGISRVFLAADGKEAYEVIKKERPDIAIIDIIMPEMTGIEVISRFRNEEEGPEFVIISGYGEFDYAQEAIRHNVNNYILKPCDTSEIANTIKKIISKIERRQSIEEEQLYLKEYINLLMPQAQEQILRDFITGSSTNGSELFHKVFGRCCEKFQLLLFSPEDPDDYSKLPTLKRCIDNAPGIQGWHFSTVLRDCVALVFDAEAGTGIKDTVNQICKTAARFSITGVRAAVSAKGAIDSLPEMYRKAWEAVRLFSPRGAGGSKVPGAVPLIDASTSQYSKPIRQVIQYVRENLSDSSLSLNHIASNILYLNPDYLGRLFKKECGVKFSDYLMAVRMEKAKRIIAMSSDLKMYEVAQQVGLGDNAAYFGQVFRKYTGMLPSEYRMKHAKFRISNTFN